MRKKLLFPDDVRGFLGRRYARQHRSWLEGGGVWPLTVSLSNLTEDDMGADVALARSWVEAWSSFEGVGEVRWAEVRFRRLGTQRIPTQVRLASAFEAASMVGEHARFERAAARYRTCSLRWPRLRGAGCVAGHFEAFADYSDQDFERLLNLVAWLVEHPASGYYLRQLPIPGMDTKWIERGRGKLVASLVGAIRDSHARDSPARDFYAITGIRPPAHRLRMRVLCPELRRATGGLADVEAPVAEVAALPIAPACVVIVENLETGLALPELPGCVAFMKLGHAVSTLRAVPWLPDARVVYWGDIDTHGLAILDRARGSLGHVTATLMDEVTLLAHRHLWTEEPAQHPASELVHLTPPERRLFDALGGHLWGHNVRLEQERIRWPDALEAISHACLDPVVGTGTSPTDQASRGSSREPSQGSH